MQGRLPMSTALPAGPSGRFPGLDRMRPALFLDRQQPVLWLMTVLSLHVIVWTYFGTATHGVIHHDMAEAWAWGQEFELGYSKHPPLFAWVTALWFKLLPRENWA